MAWTYFLNSIYGKFVFKKAIYKHNVHNDENGNSLTKRFFFYFFALIKIIGNCIHKSSLNSLTLVSTDSFKKSALLIRVSLEVRHVNRAFAKNE